MSKTVQDIMELIREKDIKMVDFKMVDIHGQFRHVTIPARDFNEEIMENGVIINPLKHGALPQKGYLTGYTLSGTA